MMRKSLRYLLWVVLVLALIPAGILAVQRLNVEGRATPIAVVLDELALHQQAALYGINPFELALHYQTHGLPGVALYEESIDSLALRGAVVALPLSEFNALALAYGEEPTTTLWNATAVSEIEAGVLAEGFVQSTAEPIERTVGDRTWYIFPGDISELVPVGPNARSVEAYHDAGFEIAYRPLNAPVQTVQPGSTYPAEASYLIHSGSIIDGFPGGLTELIEASEPFYTAIIESTPQAGLSDIASKVPTVRLLSFNQDHINRRLLPHDLIDKYLLAVEERNIRMLYVRPYTTNELGDPIANTEQLISGLVAELERSGYEVGALSNERLVLEPNGALRFLAGLGIVAGVGLVALAFPGAWSALVFFGVPLVAFVFAGALYPALALLAALLFPVLGFLVLPERFWSIFGATLLSLLGALFLAAVGSDTATINALQPFRGVGLTLIIPPVVFLVGYLLRHGTARSWLTTIWNVELRGSHVVLAGVAIAVLGIVVLRRGNDPIIGVTEIELLIRQALGEFTARPRFKELIGHPFATLALAAAATIPFWARSLLLTLGVVAQASILNSFSHFHTPLPISLERTVVAVVIGVVLGLLLTVIWNFAHRWWTRAATH